MVFGGIQPAHVAISHKRYAKGRKAKAQCPICGDVVAYLALVRDWRGVMVCSDCKDPRHPQENIIIHTDPEALEHPSPLLDTASGSAVVRPRVIRATFILRPATVVVT